MMQVQLTTSEEKALRILNDPDSDDPVSWEAMESLIAKGLLYRTSPKGVDLTDLGEQVCQERFGGRSKRFDFGE